MHLIKRQMVNTKSTLQMDYLLLQLVILFCLIPILTGAAVSPILSVLKVCLFHSFGIIPPEAMYSRLQCLLYAAPVC